MAKLRFLRAEGAGPSPIDGRYLVSYNPEYHLPNGEYDGGELITTSDPDKALDLPTVALFLIYKSGPSCPKHRKDSDGSPNRPLTRWSITID